MKKEYTFTVAALDTLRDPTAVLFDLNVKLNALREDLKKEIHGKTIRVGDFRGTAVQVSGGKVLLRHKSEEHEYSITNAMLSQLEATTR